jgi:hypothetical protein
MNPVGRRKKLSSGKEDETLRKEGTVTPVGYLGQTALRREQCDM